MTTGNYWTTRISRRGVMRGAALGGAGLAGAALIGCGGDDADEADAMPTEAGGGTASATTAATTETGSDGGSTSPKRGGRVTLNIAAEPPNFDMHANSTYAVNNAISPLFNTLVQFDPMLWNEPPDAIIPDLAESWETGDGMQFVFNLVDGATFQNGQTFSSADVKATFERIMDPPEGVVSPRQDQFAPVESIEVPDDRTVVFNLSRPAASMLPIIATGWNVIYSAEDIGNDVDFQAEVNGTGPFRLQEYLRGNRLEMVRNEEYHIPELPYLDEFFVFVIPEASTALSTFQAGELMVHRAPTVADTEAIVASVGDQIEIDGPIPSYGFDTVNFGQRDPWGDDRVRRAVAMAVNKLDAVAVVEQGDGGIGGYLMPGGTWAISEEDLLQVPGYQAVNDNTIAEARKLLDAAGVANPYDTTMLTRNVSETLSIFLRDQLAKVGMNAVLDVQETAAAYDTLNRRAFDLAPWGHAYALDDPDAVFAEFYITGAPRNYSEIGSAEVDDLFAQQSSELDFDARVELVHQMEAQALDLYGKVVSSWANKREARWKSVRDRALHSSNYNNARWERVWLDV